MDGAESVESKWRNYVDSYVLVCLVINGDVLPLKCRHVLRKAYRIGSILHSSRGECRAVEYLRRQH